MHRLRKSPPKPARKKTATRKGPAAATAPLPAGVVLRGENGYDFNVPAPPTLGMAKSWNSILRNRRRFVWSEAGQAYPGYWASEEAHARFRKLVCTPVNTDPESLAAVDTGDCPPPGANTWTLDAARHDKLPEFITAGNLMPLETVAMTRREGFPSAVQQATDRFRDLSQGLEWL